MLYPGIVRAPSLSDLLSVMVMVPTPTSLLPLHENFAPDPSTGPSKATLQFGSIFAHGDHSCHFLRSLM